MQRRCAESALGAGVAVMVAPVSFTPAGAIARHAAITVLRDRMEPTADSVKEGNHR
jgi:hypothetical protein